MRGWGGIKYFFLLFIINYKRSFDVYVKKLHSGLDGAKAVESEQLLLSAVWHNIKVFSLYVTYGKNPPPIFWVQRVKISKSISRFWSKDLNQTICIPIFMIITSQNARRCPWNKKKLIVKKICLQPLFSHDTTRFHKKNVSHYGWSSRLFS